MLVNESYFIGPLTLAQLGHQPVLDNLNSFIEQYEPEILIAALGYDLYNSFNLALNPGPPAQKWIDLRDGIVFNSLSGIKMQWKGLANNTTKKSVIAGWIYSMMLKDSVTDITGIGIVDSSSENSVSVSPTVKMNQAQHEAYLQLCVLWEFLRANITVYTDYSFRQINYSYFRPVNQFGI